MDALVKAAKEEGSSTSSRCPPSWANYEEMLETFGDKYDIKINSANPDGSSQDELNAVTSQKGQDRAPDVLDVGTSFAKQAAGAGPARPLQGGDLGRHPGQPEGPRRPLVQRLRRLHLDRLQRLGRRRSARPRMAELLDPQYKGQVALNGNPTQAAAAFSGVWAAALANGGSLDDIGPGIDFFVKVKDGRQLQPGRVTPATVQSGETPISLDWDYVNAGLTDTAEGGRLDWQVNVPTRRPVRQLLQPGDQQVRPAPGRGPAVGGVPLQRRGPEHLAQGPVPPGPARRHAGGRHRGRRRRSRRCPRSTATVEFPTDEQQTAAQKVVADRWNAEMSG